MKKYLLTGLILLLPFALTLFVILLLFDFLTAPFISIVGPIIEAIPVHWPAGFDLFLSRILALIFLCIFILFLGFVTQLFIVKNLFSWGNRILYRIPFVKTIYRTSRDIFSALLSTDGKKAFKGAVSVPFPGGDGYCMGFESGEVPDECEEKVGTKLIPVFVPTAPHPISGFLILYPEKDVVAAPMSNEETIKFLVSCGMIVPEIQEETDGF